MDLQKKSKQQLLAITNDLLHLKPYPAPDRIATYSSFTRQRNIMAVFDHIFSGGKQLESLGWAAFNTGFHAGFGSLLGAIGGAMTASPVGNMVKIGAAGSAITGAIVGVARSNVLGVHFKPHEISSSLHAGAEVAVSLVTTIVGGAAGKWALGQDAEAQNVFASMGYPALIIAGVTFISIAAKEANAAGWIQIKCPSLPKFSIFGGGSEAESFSDQLANMERGSRPVVGK
jgi:hypothetical protein